jgi:hypothetical protein
VGVLGETVVDDVADIPVSIGCPGKGDRYRISKIGVDTAPNLRIL